MDFKTYRLEDLKSQLTYMPLDVMLVGSTGAGKSTLVNLLMGKEVSKVGRGVDPETMDVSDFKVSDYFRVWDTPGLGDGVKADKIHRKKISKLLRQKAYVNGKKANFSLIDLVLVVIEGSHRDLGTVLSLLNEVIVPHIDSSRIVVAINQADLAMSGRHWKGCGPDKVLRDYLNEMALSVKRRVFESTGVRILKPVCFSAEYGWNVERVVDWLVKQIPRI